MPLTPRRPSAFTPPPWETAPLQQSAFSPQPPPLPGSNVPPPLPTSPSYGVTHSPPASAASRSLRSTSERLLAAERHPEFRALAEHKPRQGFARGSALGDSLGGIVLPGGAVALIVKSFRGRTTGDKIGPLILALAALAFGGWFAWRAVRFFLAEVERRAAVVKDTRLIERRHKGRTYYQYRVTLETATNQSEWKTDRATWTAARTGAVVLAFTRADYLLEMVPLDA